MDELYKTMQKRLVELVGETGMSASAVAKEMGMKHRQQLDNYLHGRERISLAKAVQIADYFNINPAWLMGFIETREVVK